MASFADPGAVELEELKQRLWGQQDLIAAVEALREREVELAGALERIVKGNHRCPTPMALLAWAKDEARTILAATPAEAVK